MNSRLQLGANQARRNSSPDGGQAKRDQVSWAPQTRAEARRAQGLGRRAGGGKANRAARGEQEQQSHMVMSQFKRWAG